MFVRMRIAGSDDAGRIPVIIRESGDRPLLRIGLRHTVSVEQVAHAHDVLIAMMRFVDNLFFLQDMACGGHCLLQQTPACRTRERLPGLGWLLQTEGLRLRI